MAGTLDILAQEKAIGQSAANILRRDFKNALAETTHVSGESKKATVRAGFRYGRLDRITFSAPYYQYIQHNGFEGSKKNGIQMHLEATNVLNIALAKSKVLEHLADGIADLRGEEVLTKINF